MPTETYYPHSTEHYQNYATDDVSAATAYNLAHNCIEPYHDSRDVDWEVAKAIGQVCWSHSVGYPAGFLVHAADRGLLFFNINHSSSRRPVTAIRLVLFLRRSVTTPPSPEFTDYYVSIRNLTDEDVEELDPYTEVYPKLLLGTEIAHKYVPDIPDYEVGVWYRYEFELVEGVDINLSGWTPISMVTTRDIAGIVPTSVPDPGSYEYIMTYLGKDVSTRRSRVEVDYIGDPTVTTNAATSVAAASATLNGTLDDDGGEACDCGFEWGPTISYGTTTSSQSKTTGQSFSQEISGLEPNTGYHYRAVATNSWETGYGDDRSFTSKQRPDYPVTGERPEIYRAYALSRWEF